MIVPVASFVAILPLLTMRRVRAWRLAVDDTGRIVLPKKCGGVIDLFVQPSAPQPSLYLFGAGHVNGALAPMALAAGFRVTVLDDRDGFPDPAVFPGEAVLRHGPFAELVDGLAFDADRTYCVIVAYSHVKDEEILEACLRSACAPRSNASIAVSILAELLAVRNEREQVVPMSRKNKRGG